MLPAIPDRLDLLASEQTQQVAEAVARLTEFVLAQFFNRLAVNEALHQLGGITDPLVKTAVATQIGELEDELPIRGKQ